MEGSSIEIGAGEVVNLFTVVGDVRKVRSSHSTQSLIEHDYILQYAPVI